MLTEVGTCEASRSSVVVEVVKALDVLPEEPLLVLVVEDAVVLVVVVMVVEVDVVLALVVLVEVDVLLVLVVVEVTGVVVEVDVVLVLVVVKVTGVVVEVDVVLVLVVVVEVVVIVVMDDSSVVSLIILVLKFLDIVVDTKAFLVGPVGTDFLKPLIKISVGVISSLPSSFEGKVKPCNIWLNSFSIVSSAEE